MRKSSTPIVAVTGAHGYVGSVVLDAFDRRGWRTKAMVRQPGRGPGVSADGSTAYELGSPISPRDLEGLDAIVHCAYDLRATKARAVREMNVDGTRRLVEAAVKGGVGRIILISSMSAYRGTTQIYGKAKLACEEVVLEAGGIAVRLGLVCGGQWRGMAGALRRLARFPLIPLVSSEARQYLIHEDDMASGLVTLVESHIRPAAPIGLAHPDSITFENLMKGLAVSQGCKPRFVRIPWRALYIPMRLVEVSGVHLPLRSDSMVGLVRPAPYVPHADIWTELGLTLRPPASIVTCGVVESRSSEMATEGKVT
jgi:nucleoside-diphosphate-sugar epimerase